MMSSNYPISPAKGFASSQGACQSIAIVSTIRLKELIAEGEEILGSGSNAGYVTVFYAERS